jgi:LacI family transcriptional regulator
LVVHEVALCYFLNNSVNRLTKKGTDMKHATLADVAKATGVSVSLVSLVLAGKAAKRCSPAVESKIKRAAKDLGYRANRLARSLKEQQTRTLGMLSIEVATTPYAGQLLSAAQKTARAHDYELLFVEVENNPKSIEEAFGLLAEHQVVGTIIAAYFHSEVKLPKARPKNLVLANCITRSGSYPTIIPAEYASYMQSLKLLGIAGHKHVGLIIDEVEWPAVEGRTKAFLDAAQNFDWVRPNERIYKVSKTIAEHGYRATLEMMVRDPEITAIACYNDPLAMGTYQALKELRIGIPEQVSVVGFDDLELISGGLRPGLTTVRLPHYQMGREAVEQLIRICEEKDEKPMNAVEIQGELVVRDSVSVPRNSAASYSSSEDSARSNQEEEK